MGNTKGGFRISRDDPLNVLPPLSASPPTFLSTFDRESRYPIFDTLRNCLSIAEIVSLTQTCKTFSGLYQYLLPVQWDVDKALRRYVDDPYGFRSQMAKHDALISDDFATKYFERATWKVYKLCVVIRQGFGVDPFSKYISETEGYAHVEVEKYDTDCHTQEMRIFRRDADSDIEICLKITNCPPVQQILWDAETTVGVNILSWNKAYSVFPLPTFIQHKCYLLQTFDEVCQEEARYRSRLGWKVQGVMWPEERRRNHPIRERRRVGDRYTWTIPFDTRKVESSKTPDYVLEHACFTMDLSKGYDDDEVYDGKGGVRNYAIELDARESRSLKHTYLLGNDGWDFISRRLHSFTILELRKMDPAKRPTNYNQILENLDNFDFSPDASWTYPDDEIPTWYKAFEKYKPERVQL